MNAQILPFYKSLNLQNRNKPWYNPSPLFTHYVGYRVDYHGFTEIKLPAFQLELLTAGMTPVYVQLVMEINGAPTYIDIDIQLDVMNVGTKQYFTHVGQVFTNLQVLLSDLYLQNAIFYIIIFDGEEIHYSETFRLTPLGDDAVLAACGNWLYLTFTSNKNIAGLEYEAIQFGQTILLAADIGRPTYLYKEDGEEDGKGEFYQTFRRVEKTFEIELYAPEYICDALSLLPLHSNAVVFSNYGDYNMNDIRFEVKDWETDDLARCTITFQTDFVAVRGSC